MKVRHKIRKKGKSFAERLKARADKENKKMGFAWIIFSVVFRFFDHAVLGKAAELAYYLLFSFMALIIFFTAFLGNIHIDITYVEELAKLVPEDVQNIIANFHKFIQSSNNSMIMYTGLFLSIYFVSAAIRSLMRSTNVAFDVKVPRNPVLGLLFSFLFAAVFLVVMVFVIILMIVGGLIVDAGLQVMPYLESYKWIVNILRYLVMILPLLIVFMLLYKFAPSTKVKWRETIPGSVFTVIVWMLASLIFSFYVSNYGRYTTIYGSFGTVIVLMIWLYVTGAVFVMGGEINAVLMKRKHQLKDRELLDSGDDKDSAEPDFVDE